ncbi:MAG: glycosyltransferase [Hyphomonas sp.]
MQDALDSLTHQTCRDFEVILIDNASTDGSIDQLDTKGLPAFILLAETENHGYAGGMNRAAAKATSKWLVGLNPDAVADATWLEGDPRGLAASPGGHHVRLCPV